MGYDQREQPSSSGAAVAIVVAVLIVIVLGIVAVGGAALFWVRTSRVEAMVARERVVAELHRAGTEAQRADAMDQLEQAQIDAPGSRLNFELKLDREGNMSVAGDVIGLDDLRTRIAEFKDKSHNTFFLRINADPECHAKHITAVLAVCDEVGDIDCRIVSSEDSETPPDKRDAKN